MNKTKGKDRDIFKKNHNFFCVLVFGPHENTESAIFVVLLYVQKDCYTLFSAFKVFKVENPSAAFHHALC